MPILRVSIPKVIWDRATVAERDSIFVNAGFVEGVGIEQDGHTSTTFNFRQGGESSLIPNEETFGIHQTGMQAGDDTRDFTQEGVHTPIPTSIPTPSDPLTAIDVGVVPIAGGLSIAGRALRIALGGGGGRILAATWAALPSALRTSLAQVGIGVGALVAFNGDIPFITLPGQGGSLVRGDGSDASLVQVGQVDIQVGRNPLQPVQVVGGWVANGVTFYRLADGKIAVQNKKGRWKVWRPKHPIVIYADGATDIKTMLKADKALNRQAKQIAAMLNRRLPKPRAKKEEKPTVIVAAHSRIVD